MAGVPGLDDLNILDGDTSEIEAEDLMDSEAGNDKACIVVKEECAVDCGIYDDSVYYEEGQRIPVQFNPTSYSIKTSSNFKDELGGIEQDSLTFGEYSSPAKRRLNVKLLYDSIIQIDYLDKMNEFSGAAKRELKTMTLDVMGITDSAEKIYDAYTKYDDEEDLNESYIRLISNLVRASDLGRPPLISFIYGNVEFVGHASSVDVNYVRFNKIGDVIRAEIDLEIDEVTNDEEGGEGGLGGLGGLGKESSVISDDALGLMDKLK